MTKLSDAEAKRIMRQFPRTTGVLLRAPEDQLWIRCCPKDEKLNDSPMPHIKKVGENRKTMPDGMYTILYPSLPAADVIVFEVCGSQQNLSDKRSRYGPMGGSKALEAPAKWLKETIYKKPYLTGPRWEFFGTFDEAPKGNLNLPIRTLKAVFVVTDDEFAFQEEARTAEPHEFFIPMVHFKERMFWTKSFKNFAQVLTPASHYFST